MSIEIGGIQKYKKKTDVKKNTISATFQNVFSSKKLSDKKKLSLYKDLAVLLKAGIDFKTALTVIRDQQNKEVVKTLVDSILRDVIKGKALYEAMKLTGKFTVYEIFSIKIGEETRKLDAILEELQKFFMRKVKLKKQIISILTYPAFILLLTFATLYFMLTYVVPLFQSVFSQFDKELPTLTKYIISLSENFNFFFGIFLVSILLLGITYHRVKNNDAFKKISTKLILRVPFFGKLIKEIYITRFCQSMALLLVSKTSLVESLILVRKMIGFYPISKALVTVEKDITKGEGLGNSLARYAVFDANLISMVKIAEQVNQLDTMFVRLAEQYDDEVSHKTKIMGTVIEPLLILFIGGIVGLIMISMYAPMFDLSEVIGGK